MEINFFICAIAAVVPLLIGFIWYGPLFSKAWMKEMSFTEESLKDTNMVVVFLVSYILGFMIALGLLPAVVHQMGIYSTLAAEPDFKDGMGEAFQTFSILMETYGSNFRTFKHGAFHGGLTAVFIAVPILAIQAMFERKSLKYIAINGGYWIITLAIMGGIICQWI